MKPPEFAPPYDSPIEEEFARVITKHLHRDVDLQAQYSVDTLCGRFVLDFVVIDGDRRVGFECDGKEFHEPSRDEWRDAMILGDGAVDVIYRLRGSDIYRRVEECLHLIACREPKVFSDRGRSNLRTLATPRLRDFDWDGQEDIIVYWDVDREGRRTHTPEFVKLIGRERAAMNDTERRHFWVQAYRWVSERGGGALDTVIANWRTAHLIE